MKKWLVVIFALATPGLIFAGPKNHRSSYVSQEFQSIFESSAESPIGEVSLGEVREMLGLLSIAMQKEAYISGAKKASFMIPGLGQFKTGDTLSGVLFLSTDILLTAGALVGAYFLLPDDLQFGQLDYFNTPFSDIKDAWHSHTFVEMLPSMGVVAGGWLLQAGLRMWSSKHASKLARRNIEEGVVSFEPRLLMMPGMGVGIGIGVRY